MKKCCNNIFNIDYSPKLIDCNNLNNILKILKKNFKKCNILTSNDMKLLIDVIYSINECNNNSNLIDTKGYTVDTLPVGRIGDVTYVTDADQIAYTDVVVGGGTEVVPVFFNGKNWIYS